MNTVARMLKRSALILFIIESVALFVVLIVLTISDAEPIVQCCVFGGGLLISFTKYLILFGFATIIDLLDKIEKNTHNGKDYSSNESKKEMNKKQYKHNKAKRTYEEDEEAVAKIEEKGWENAAKECGVGVPTVQDIVAELLKPGRDIRDTLPKPVLRSDLMDLADLKEGMEINGTVRNVIDFGVFVDIGVHQDG